MPWYEVIEYAFPGANEALRQESFSDYASAVALAQAWARANNEIEVRRIALLCRWRAGLRTEEEAL